MRFFNVRSSKRKDDAATDLSNAKADPDFVYINSKFESRGVRTWSSIEERALLFSLASRSEINTVVEIGSFCGGSAAFLAEAMRLKNLPKSVFCVDPFMGAPVWFPRGYMHSTYEEFHENIGALGIANQIVEMRGESSAVASIWPARPIDLLFIDGDHSLLGVISDFEKWAPKVSRGGFILIDDVDHIQEVSKFVEILESISGLASLGTVGGISVYRRTEDTFDVTGDLLGKLDSLDIHRPWSYAGLAAKRKPDRFVRHDWPSDAVSTCYDLAYFSIAPSGDYGITKGVSEIIKTIARTVVADKGDGRLIDLPEQSALRVCFCTLDDLASCSSMLQPGTVVLAETEDPAAAIARARAMFTAIGIEGLGNHEGGHVFWGVYHPHMLSPDAIISSHFRNAFA